MSQQSLTVISGVIIEDDELCSLQELCEMYQFPEEFLLEMIEFGLLEPIGHDQNDWKIPAKHLSRLLIAYRLHRDLEINAAGLALILELLEEVKSLRRES